MKYTRKEFKIQYGEYRKHVNMNGSSFSQFNTALNTNPLFREILIKCEYPVSVKIVNYFNLKTTIMKSRVLTKKELMEYLTPMLQDNEALYNYFEGYNYTSETIRVEYVNGFMKLYVNDCFITKRPDFDREINYID